jgi:hypothetical protein
MPDAIIADHKLTPAGWECLKCGHTVKPQDRGHHCWERSEAYTERPELGSPIERLDRIEKRLESLMSNVAELLERIPAKEKYPDG